VYISTTVKHFNQILRMVLYDQWRIPYCSHIYFCSNYGFVDSEQFIIANYLIGPQIKAFFMERIFCISSRSQVNKNLQNVSIISDNNRRNVHPRGSHNNILWLATRCNLQLCHYNSIRQIYISNLLT